MITIGIVLYNEEKHLSLLERNLSLLMEQPCRIQVVLVDNASTDQTPQYLKAQQQRFAIELILRSENNMGAARQDVVASSRHKWVGFIDGDCEIDELWIRTVLTCVQTLPVEVAAFGGPWTPRGHRSKLYEALFSTPFGHFSLPQLSFKEGVASVAHIPTANVIYRRQDLVDIGGFFPGFSRVGEDLDVSLRLRARGKKLWMMAAMPIGHYLPESSAHWCGKIFIYGCGRVHVALSHGTINDRILILPLVFLAVAGLTVAFQVWWLAIFYFLSVTMVSLIYKKQASALGVAHLLVLTHFSYALGMAFEWSRQGLHLFLKKGRFVPPIDNSLAEVKKASFAPENS